jgi:hypothetical protein
MERGSIRYLPAFVIELNGFNDGYFGEEEKSRTI